MNNQSYLKEEVEYLRKRSWDLIANLEKLNAEFKDAKDSEQKQLLKDKIDRTKTLLDNYIEKHQRLCLEAGLTQEMLTPKVAKYDIVEATKNAMQPDKIEIARFFNVPPRNEQFTGREEEVINFIERVLDGGAFAICGVKGRGGIGKTEIAKEVCHLFGETWNNTPKLPDYAKDLLNTKKHFVDGILWIQFEPENQTPKTVTQYAINAITDIKTAEKIPDLLKLADILATKDVLVILDSVEQNLRTFDYVYEIFKGRFPLIITSRIAIPSIHSIDINVLKDEEAYNLFVKQFPDVEIPEAKQAEIKALCNVLGNYPLMIKIAASRVDTQLSNISELIEKFQQNNDVQNCFVMSFNDLNHFEQKVFTHCAIFGNAFSVLDLAGVLNEEDETKIEPIVAKLVEFSLLNRLQAKDSKAVSYDLHPLMREFALNLLMQSVKVIEGKKQEIEALLEQLEQAEKENQLLTLLQDKILFQQIIEAMNYCDSVLDFSTVEKLMDKINDFILRLGYWKQKVELNGLTIRSTLALQNKNSEAFYRMQFADTLWRKAASKFELEQTEKYFKQALSIYQKINNPEKVLFIQYALSDIQNSLNKLRNSIISSYQGIRQSSKYNNLYNHGRFNKNIANSYKLFLLNQLFVLFKVNFKIKKEDVNKICLKENLLKSHGDIIVALYIKGEIIICFQYFKKQLELSEKLQSAENYLYTLESLFNCSFYLQQTDFCQQLLTIYLQLSIDMGFGEENRVILKAKFSYLVGDYKAAIQLFSINLFEDNPKQHEVHYWLGKTYLLDNNLDKAEHHLKETLAFYQGQKNAHQIANVYIELALLAFKRNQLETAIHYLGIAIKTKESLDCKLLPEQETVKQTILAALNPENAEFEKYQTLITEAEPLKLIPDFILHDLPATITGKDNKLMVLIPEGGAFVGKGEIETLSLEDMLNNIDIYMEGNAYDGKETATEICLYPYYIDQEAVSNAEYQAFCLANNYTPPEHWQDGKISANSEHLPVVNISLEDAKAYAKWAEKEIPTAMEWEKACRGEDGLLYPWGNEWNETKVKVKNGEVRKQYDEIYAEVIEPVIGKGVGKLASRIYTIDKQCFDISFNTSVQVNKDEFISLLKGSLSLSQSEKQRVIDAVPTLNQFQIDELIKVWLKEKSRFIELEKQHPEDIALLKERRDKHLINLEKEYHDNHLLRISPSPSVQFDEDKFLTLLEGSLSLLRPEKQRVIDAMPTLSQFQIDELIKTWLEEQNKFIELEKEHPRDLALLRRRNYDAFNLPLLADVGLEYMNRPEKNVSPYGVCNMVGNIYEMTETETGERHLIKGGSWFVENPQQDFQAWTNDSLSLKTKEKRIDVGFRCVKPIFSQAEVEAL